MNPRVLPGLLATVAAGASPGVATVDLTYPPYGFDALEPFLSERALTALHAERHAKYVEALNDLIEEGDEELRSMSLGEIVMSRKDAALSRNGALAWNYHFFWKSMRPVGGGEPGGALADQIEEDFGSLDDMVAEAKKKATKTAGPGWVWLVFEPAERRLIVVRTPGYDTGANHPLMEGLIPILTIDMSEHAYSLDYPEPENRKGYMNDGARHDSRRGYVSDFFEELVDWDFAASNLDMAVKSAQESAEKNGDEL